MEYEMAIVARNEPFFTFGPEVTLERLLPAFPNRLLQAYVDVTVSSDLIDMTADRDMLAYFTFPPVTLITVDMLRWTHLPLLLDLVRKEQYPGVIELLGHIHIPRIFELINKQANLGLLKRSRARNIFAFRDYAVELIYTREADEREWLLQPRAWDEFAFKRNDRVFLVKQEPSML